MSLRKELKEEFKDLFGRAYSELHPDLQKRTDDGIRTGSKISRKIKDSTDEYRRESKTRGDALMERTGDKVDGVKRALTFGILGKKKSKGPPPKPLTKMEYAKGMFDDVMGGKKPVKDNTKITKQKVKK